MALFKTTISVPWQVGSAGGCITLDFVAFDIMWEADVELYQLLQIILGNTLDSMGFFKPTETKAPQKSFLENIERVRDACSRDEVVKLGFVLVSASGYLDWLPDLGSEARIHFDWVLEEV